MVAHGYTQVEGIDFDKTFSPIAHLKPIRIFLAIVCHIKFKLYLMDLKNAFLNGLLQEVYVASPKGIPALGLLSSHSLVMKNFMVL